MTSYDKIYKICRENNGIITANQASENSIPSWYLSDLVRKGKLDRISRGIYITAGGDYDDYYFFQLKNSRCIYSFSSALYLHGLTDRIPFKKEVTVYKGYNGKHITDGTIVHYINKSIYDIGRTECETVFGNKVISYDKERTICDLISYRKNIDVEVFSKAVKTFASDPDRDYKKLRGYAREMNIQSKIDEILELI